LESFGGRLKKALADAGRDQRWLAQNLVPKKGRRVRDATVSAWVTDAALPEGDYMVQLPKLLGCNMHWLITGEGENKIVEPGEAERRLSMVREMLQMPADMFKRLPRPNDNDDEASANTK
jgi:hypothetical protein